MANDGGGALEREITGRFGLLPSLFAPSAAAPEAGAAFWSFARDAYLDIALPSIFKERVFVHLSRFCEARYCIIRHVGFLLGLGRPAGDPEATPQTIDDVVDLLSRPVPDGPALQSAIKRIEEAAASGELPEPGTALEAALFDALSALYREPARAGSAREAIRGAFGERTLELLLSLIAFIRNSHFWSETHPDARPEPDVLALMADREDLARALLDPSEAEAADAKAALGRALDELGAVRAALGESEAELRKNLAASRESEARLAALFESLPVGVAVVDRDGAFILSNQEMRRFVPNEVMPSQDRAAQWRWRGEGPDGRVLQPDEFPGARGLRGERTVPGIEMRYTDEDGRQIWTSVSVTPIRDDRGELAGQVTVVSDIDALKRNDEALKASEQRFRQFGEASSAILWIRDAKTLGCEYLTPAFETIYGASLDEALGGDTLQNWLDLIVPEDRERALDCIKRVAQGDHVTFEYRIRRKGDGAIRWLRNTDFPLRDRSGVVERIGGIGEDVTEARELSARMELMVSELQHRTRNLMAVVQALAAETSRSSRSLEEFAPTFNRRLGALARALGLLSRLNEGERVTFDELIEAELSASAIDRRVRDAVSLDGPSGVRLRSRTLQTLALAIHELAASALRRGAFSDGGARLAISWRLDPPGEDGRAVLEMSWIETGVSLPPEDELRRDGFVRELIEEALPFQLGARTRYELTRDGVRCVIALPTSGPEC